MSDDRTRRGLSVAALILILMVPIIVGWCVERTAYGNARATESLLAPLGIATAPSPPATTREWHALGEPNRAPIAQLPSR